MISVWGQYLLTLAGVSLTLLSPIYDFDRRHVFHPKWPAHARYHAAAYTLTNMGFGALGLWITWAKPEWKWLAIGILSWPGIVMILASMFPGVSSYAEGEKSFLKLPVSLWGTFFYLGLCAIAAAI